MMGKQGFERRSMGEILDAAGEQIQNVTDWWTYEPRTEQGKEALRLATEPFEKLFKLGDKNAAIIYKESIRLGLSPSVAATLAALEATIIQSGPILIPYLGKKFQPIAKVKASNWWRMKDIKQRGLVTGKLAKFAREGMSEGELLRFLGRESERFEQWNKAVGPGTGEEAAKPTPKPLTTSFTRSKNDYAPRSGASMT